MKPLVPAIDRIVASLSVIWRCWRARPRSPRRACPSASRKILLGLMSRCRICACVCCRVRGIHNSCVVVWYSVMQSDVVCCRALQSIAGRCRVLHGVAMGCGALSHTPGAYALKGRGYADNQDLADTPARASPLSLPNTANYCNILQHTA